MDATQIAKFTKVKFSSLSFERIEGWPNSKPEPIQALIELPNGFILSIVRHHASYGGLDGLYEIGCIKDGEMIYIDVWNDQVKGWLSETDVENEIEYIQNL